MALRTEPELLDTVLRLLELALCDAVSSADADWFGFAVVFCLTAIFAAFGVPVSSGHVSILCASGLDFGLMATLYVVEGL